MATLQQWDTSYAPTLTTKEYYQIKTSVELEDVTDDWYDDDGNLIP